MPHKKAAARTKASSEENEENLPKAFSRKAPTAKERYGGREDKILVDSRREGGLLLFQSLWVV